MKASFISAMKTLRTSGNANMNIVCVNGCCYGRCNKIDRGDYLKLCGQRFWEFISGNDNLYLEIIEPLAHQAKERTEEFLNEYHCLLNRLSRDFMNNYCLENGRVDWEKIVKLNAGKSPPPRKPTSQRRLQRYQSDQATSQ